MFMHRFLKRGPQCKWTAAFSWSPQNTTAFTQKLSSLIEVYDRNGTMLYSNGLHDGDWKDAPKAVAAVEQERNRKLTDDERRQYIDSWPRVFEYLHKRGASSAEIGSVNTLAERFIQELKDSTQDL
jgi:hypothetical protein